MLTRISQKVCRDARWQQEADAINYAPAAIKKSPRTCSPIECPSSGSTGGRITEGENSNSTTLDILWKINKIEFI